MINLIAKAYHQPGELVTGFLSFMRSRNLVIDNDCGICFFLRLTDETLEEIRFNHNLIRSADYMRKALMNDGPNIHIIGIYLSKKFNLLAGYQMLLEKGHPKSISWLNRSMTKLIYRRTSCQFQ